MENRILSPFSSDVEETPSKSSKFSFVRLPKEKFSSYSHLLGAIVSLLGLPLLIVLSYPSTGKIIISLIYTISTSFLLFSSGFYHAFKRKENEISIWRKLDHIAIFVMIAGTYTPICYIYLDGIWRWGIIGAQWFLVICGLVLKLLILNTPRFVTIGIYLLQGWMAVLPFYQLYKQMSHLSLILMALGGILYTIGAFIYDQKKPNFIQDIFGFHEIFHVLILMGAFCHYVVVLLAMLK